MSLVYISIIEIGVHRFLAIQGNYNYGDGELCGVIKHPARAA